MKTFAPIPLFVVALFVAALLLSVAVSADDLNAKNYPEPGVSFFLVADQPGAALNVAVLPHSNVKQAVLSSAPAGTTLTRRETTGNTVYNAAGLLTVTYQPAGTLNYAVQLAQAQRSFAVVWKDGQQYVMLIPLPSTMTAVSDFAAGIGSVGVIYGPYAVGQRASGSSTDDTPPFTLVTDKGNADCVVGILPRSNDWSVLPSSNDGCVSSLLSYNQYDPSSTSSQFIVQGSALKPTDGSNTAISVPVVEENPGLAQYLSIANQRFTLSGSSLTSADNPADVLHVVGADGKDAIAVTPPTTLPSTGTDYLTTEERDKLKATQKNVNGLRDLISAAAEEYGLPEELLLAIITQESVGNPCATTGDSVGIMQLGAATANDNGKGIPYDKMKCYNNPLCKSDLSCVFPMDEEWRYDPAKAIPPGADNLANLYKQFSKYADADAFVIASYNAGPAPIKNAIAAVGGDPSWSDVIAYLEQHPSLITYIKSTQQQQRKVGIIKDYVLGVLAYERAWRGEQMTSTTAKAKAAPAPSSAPSAQQSGAAHSTLCGVAVPDSMYVQTNDGTRLKVVRTEAESSDQYGNAFQNVYVDTAGLSTGDDDLRAARLTVICSKGAVGSGPPPGDGYTAITQDDALYLSDKPFLITAPVSPDEIVEACLTQTGDPAMDFPPFSIGMPVKDAVLLVPDGDTYSFPSSNVLQPSDGFTFTKDDDGLLRVASGAAQGSVLSKMRWQIVYVSDQGGLSAQPLPETIKTSCPPRFVYARYLYNAENG